MDKRNRQCSSQLRIGDGIYGLLAGCSINIATTVFPARSDFGAFLRRGDVTRRGARLIGPTPYPSPEGEGLECVLHGH